MQETNFKNWLFGLNLHNNPAILYSLYKVLSEKAPNEYIKNYRLEAGFWTWFTEKFLSHPHLTKRIDKLFIS